MVGVGTVPGVSTEAADAGTSAVERLEIGRGDRRRAPLPGGPDVEILIGAQEGRPIGVLHVTVPPGGVMPAHEHGASEVLLISLGGEARVVDAQDGAVTELAPGALATIPVGRRVSLENPGSQPARLLVVLTPPDFAEQLTSWPSATG